jgi:short-subunit dehydrogenase
LELARRGAKLLVTGRREDRLLDLVEQSADLGSSAHWIAGDITSAGLRERLVETAHDDLGGLDILVNNAGVGGAGEFARADAERLRSIMEVNFFAPAELIRLTLPLLRQGRTPMIVNIGSVLGHCAVPRKSAYCASKFALHGLNDALHAELKRTGIDVLLVSPSTTATEFFNDIPLSGDKAPARHRGMSAETVARRTVRAIERGRRELILPLEGKLFVWCERLLPRVLSRILSRYG